jgi:hypothetical protein
MSGRRGRKDWAKPRPDEPESSIARQAPWMCHGGLLGLKIPPGPPWCRTRTMESMCRTNRVEGKVNSRLEPGHLMKNIY